MFQKRHSGYFADVPFVPPLEADIFFQQLRNCHVHRLDPAQLVYPSTTADFFEVRREPSPCAVHPPPLCPVPTAPQCSVPSSKMSSDSDSFLSVLSLPHRSVEHIDNVLRHHCHVEEESNLIQFFDPFGAGIREAVDRYKKGVTTPVAPHLELEEWARCYDAMLHHQSNAVKGEMLFVVVPNCDAVMESAPSVNAAAFGLFLWAAAAFFRKHESACCVRLLLTVLDDEGNLHADSLLAHCRGRLRITTAHTRLPSSIPLFDLSPIDVDSLSDDMNSSTAVACTIAAVADKVVELHEDISGEILDGEDSSGGVPLIVVHSADKFYTDSLLKVLRQKYVSPPLRLVVSAADAIRAQMDAAPLTWIVTGGRELQMCEEAIRKTSPVVRAVVCVGLAPLSASIGPAMRGHYFYPQTVGEASRAMLWLGGVVTERTLIALPDLGCHRPTLSGLSSNPEECDAASVTAVASFVMWLFRRLTVPQCIEPQLEIHIRLLLGGRGEMSELYRRAVSNLLESHCAELIGAQSDEVFHLKLSPVGRLITESWKYGFTSRLPTLTNSLFSVGARVIPAARLVLAACTLRLTVSETCDMLRAAFEIEDTPHVSVEEEVLEWTTRTRRLGFVGKTDQRADQWLEMHAAVLRLVALWGLYPQESLMRKVVKEFTTLTPVEAVLCAPCGFRESIPPPHKIPSQCRGWLDAATVKRATDGEESSAPGDAADEVNTYPFPTAQRSTQGIARAAAVSQGLLGRLKVQSPSGLPVTLLELPVDMSDTLIVVRITVMSLVFNNCIRSQQAPAQLTTAAEGTGNQGAAIHAFAPLDLLADPTLLTLLTFDGNGNTSAYNSGLWVDNKVDERLVGATDASMLRSLSRSVQSILAYCDHVAFAESKRKRLETLKEEKSQAAAILDAVYTGSVPRPAIKGIIDSFIEIAVKLGGREEAEKKTKGQSFFRPEDPNHEYYTFHIQKRFAEVKASGAKKK